MSGYIDMHCHILPEVDDGAQSIEETVQMLRIAYREGIRCIMRHLITTEREWSILKDLEKTDHSKKRSKKIVRNFDVYFRKRNFFLGRMLQKN